jgi:hypothetical protein
MELDEFKLHWKKIREQENEQQKHTAKTPEEIVMKAKAVCSALVAALHTLDVGHDLVCLRNDVAGQQKRTGF